MKNFGSFKIGQTARENWELLSEPETYWWFHLESFKSPYVILRLDEPSQVDIQRAALLCIGNSKYKNRKDLYVIYTRLKNVRKGNIVGEALVHNTSRINIRNCLSIQ